MSFLVSGFVVLALITNQIDSVPGGETEASREFDDLVETTTMEVNDPIHLAYEHGCCMAYDSRARRWNPLLGYSQNECAELNASVDADNVLDKIGEIYWVDSCPQN